MNFVHTLFILVYLGTYKSDFLFLVPAASCTRLTPRLNAAHLLPGSTRHARSSNKAHQVKRKQFYSTLPLRPPLPPLPGGAGAGAVFGFPDALPGEGEVFQSTPSLTPELPLQAKFGHTASCSGRGHWLDVGRFCLEVLVHLLR